MENTLPHNPLAVLRTGIREDAAMGVLYALFVLLFGDPFAALLQKLEALFAAFRAGTLPPELLRAQRPGLPSSEPPTPHLRPRQSRLRHALSRRARLASVPPRAIAAAHPVPVWQTQPPIPPQFHPPRIERPPRREKIATETVRRCTPF